METQFGSRGERICVGFVYSIKRGGALLPNSSTSFDQASGSFLATYPTLNGRYEAKLESENMLKGIWKFSRDQPLEMKFSEEMPDELRVSFGNIYPNDITSLEGYWSGVVEGSDNRFVSIEVAPIADQFLVRIWGARNMPLPAGPSRVVYDIRKGGGKLRVEAAEVGAMFEGEMSSDMKTIEGVWTQVESNPLRLVWTKNRPDRL